MHIQVIPCGFLKVRAVEMIKPWSLEKIKRKYPVNGDGFMRLSMNALLVKNKGHVILIDPGTADFLPQRLRQEYGFEMPESLEDVLLKANLRVEELTDLVFTHLHFDHGSGAFKRIPGNIVRRFPHASYHVLKEHYQYALNPDRVEANSFSTGLLKRLDKVHWIDDWELDWIAFRIFHGHTKGMVVPEIDTGNGKVLFATDLIPLEVFMEPEVFCGYDLHPEQVIREKQDFLDSLDPGTKLILYHDTLRDSIFYS